MRFYANVLWEHRFITKAIYPKEYYNYFINIVIIETFQGHRRKKFLGLEGFIQKQITWRQLVSKLLKHNNLALIPINKWEPRYMACSYSTPQKL